MNRQSFGDIFFKAPLVVKWGWLFLLFFLFSLAPSKAYSQQAAELLLNKDFSQGFDHWKAGPDLQWWMPLQEDGKVSLHPPVDNYKGVVVFQPLNVYVNLSQGPTISGSVSLEKVNAWEGQTIEVVLMYATAVNDRSTLSLVRIDNDEFIEESTIIEFGPVDLPQDITRITGFGLRKNTWGEFSLLGASARLSGADIQDVPRVQSISRDSGPFGTEISISGSAFGQNGQVTLGGSAGGVEVLEWQDNMIQVRLDEPARSGFINVLRESQVDSLGLFAFEVTSPSFYLSTQSNLTSFIGQEAAMVFDLNFVHGFNPQEQIHFQAVDSEGEVLDWVTIQHERTRYPGRYTARLDTLNLEAGIHTIIIEAIEDIQGGVVRRSSTELELHAVGDIKLSIWDPYDGTIPLEDNVLNVDFQGEIQLGFEFVSQDGHTSMNFWPMGYPGNVVVSANPSIVSVINARGMHGYSFHALRKGSAVLTFASPDGFSRNLTVNVNFPDEPQVTSFSVTPQIVNNSGNDTFTHYAQGTGSISIGWTVGIWDPADSDNEPSWSNSNRTVQRNAIVWQDAPLGTHVMSNGVTLNNVLASVSMPITVVNDESFSGLREQLVGPELDVMMGYNAIGLFSTEQDPGDEPAYIFFPEGHGFPGEHGAINPGDYKVGLIDGNSEQLTGWHDNAPDWESTKAVSFPAGEMVAIDFAPVAPRMFMDAHAVTVSDDPHILTMPVYLSSPADWDMGVNYVVYPITAVRGEDFEAEQLDTLIFEEGQSESQIEINILDNFLATGARTFMVSLLPDSWTVGTVEPRSMIVTIEHTTGSLSVTIFPSDAVDAGMQWRRAGTQEWFNSGEVEYNVSTGEHVVEFKPVTGFSRPDTLTVSVERDKVTNVDWDYQSLVKSLPGVMMLLLDE